MNIERPKSKQPMPEHAKCVFNGEIFDVYQYEQEMFDGSKKIYEKIKRPDTVIVFPVLPDGRILLTKQEQSGRESFIDAPGGMIDEGEAVLDAAKRELLEETGYVAENFILWKAEQMTAKIEWAHYLFIAKNITKISDQNLDSGEKVEEYIVTFDEFLKLAENPILRAREIIPDLLLAQLHKEKYKALKELFKPE